MAGPMVGATRGLLAAAAPRLAVPSPAQWAWQDLELGMFVHFAPNTWQEKEYDDLSLAPGDIMPTIDPAQWADTAAALGARYLVLVAKHVGGFCLWQTDTTDYGIRGTAWREGRGDVMADSWGCAATAHDCLPLAARRSGAGLSGATPGTSRTTRCIAPAPVLTRYGPIAELWLTVRYHGDIVAQHAPEAMVFQGPQATIRWVGNEYGFAPYPCWNALAAQDAGTGVATALHGDPEGDVWMPVEVDVSIRRPNWFWSTTNEKNLLPLDDLVEIYYRSVGRGAQLLLNLAPDRTGRIPAADAARAAEFGAEIRRRFGRPVAESNGVGRDLMLSFGAPQRVDHVVLQEELGRGERVRGGRLDGMAWDHWQLIGEGNAIGHTRIVPVRPDGYTTLWLRVNDAVSEPVIRRLAAFNAGTAPPRTWQDPVSLWADDAVGEWTGDTLSLDLSAKVPSAARYRLRLVAQDGSPVKVSDLDFRIDQSLQPTLARRAPGRKDIVLLTIPVTGRSVTPAQQEARFAHGAAAAGSQP
jgi:alpha-L-fucosidase